MCFFTDFISGPQPTALLGASTALNATEFLPAFFLPPLFAFTGADICFWDELTPVLFNLIRRALDQDVKRIIIADPGRSPFYDLAERCQARFNARVVERRTRTPRALSADLLIVDRD